MFSSKLFLTSHYWKLKQEGKKQYFYWSLSNFSLLYIHPKLVMPYITRKFLNGCNTQPKFLKKNIDSNYKNCVMHPTLKGNFEQLKQVGNSAKVHEETVDVFNYFFRVLELKSLLLLYEIRNVIVNEINCKMKTINVLERESSYSRNWILLLKCSTQWKYFNSLNLFIQLKPRYNTVSKNYWYHWFHR